MHTAVASYTAVRCTGTYAPTIMLCVHARSANVHAGARSALPKFSSIFNCGGHKSIKNNRSMHSPDRLLEGGSYNRYPTVPRILPAVLLQPIVRVG